MSFIESSAQFFPTFLSHRLCRHHVCSRPAMMAPLMRVQIVHTRTGGQGAMPLWKPRRCCGQMYLLGKVALRRALAIYAQRTAGIEADMKGMAHSLSSVWIQLR